MPLQNYKDLEYEFLDNYWENNKDILGVTHFGELVPEVLYIGPNSEKIIQELISLRIDYKQRKYKGIKPPESQKENILKSKDILKIQMEKEIVGRLEALRRYLRSPTRDPHLSLEEIFRKKRSGFEGIKPIVNYLRKRGQNLIRADKDRIS
jgi:hypothetical protein